MRKLTLYNETESGGPIQIIQVAKDQRILPTITVKETIPEGGSDSFDITLPDGDFLIIRALD